MASIYERTPHFKGQKTWSEKTPLGDVYKLQSNSPHIKQKAEIHKDSGQFGIEFTLDKTIIDFIRGAGRVDLDYSESFLEFENLLLGWYLTDWKQVLHELPEQDRSSEANF
jgi:hypothetical protein